MTDDDDQTTTIEDVDYSSKAASAVGELATVTHSDVEDAARAIVTAAAKARAREFAPMAGNTSEDNRYAYDDWATGEFWTPVEGGWQNTSTDEIISGRPDEAESHRPQFEWIVDEFRYFHERWPSYPAAMAEHCVTAKAAIQSGEMTAIKPVSDAVDDWVGHAQENFKEFFLDPYLVNTITNQQALLDELSVAMHAYEGILKQARIDAKTIADQTVDVLDSTGHGSGGGFGAFLKVVGIAFSIVSTVATAGSTTALTVGLIGAGISTAQFVESQQQVEGSSVAEILESLTETLGQLREAMDAEETAIAGPITQTTEQVRGWLASGRPQEMATILPNEPVGDGVPNLTDGELPSPDHFRPHD